MENLGIGAGLGALGFWLFIAAVSVAGIYDGIRKRDAKHETVRRALESGQALDEPLMNRLVSLDSGSGSGRPDRDFKITALWILPVSIGLAALAYFIGLAAEEAFLPIMGAAALCACLGVGFWVAGIVAARWYRDDSN